jgi:hypothetical protein
VRAYLRGGAYPRALPYLGRRARRLIPAFWLVITATLLWFGSFGADAADVLVVLAFAQVFSQGRRTSCSRRPGRSASRSCSTPRFRRWRCWCAPGLGPGRPRPPRSALLGLWRSRSS